MEGIDASAAIPGDCKAYRLVKPEWVKHGQSPPLPSSQAFQDRPETHAMSVYLEDEIAAAGRVPSDLQKHWPGYWIFYLTVHELQHDFGQVVSRDQQPDFPGHSLVRDPSGKRTQSKRSKMAGRCRLEATGDGPITPPAVAPVSSLQVLGTGVVSLHRPGWFWLRRRRN